MLSIVVSHVASKMCFQAHCTYNRCSPFTFSTMLVHTYADTETVLVSFVSHTLAKKKEKRKRLKFYCLMYYTNGNVFTYFSCFYQKYVHRMLKRIA